MKKCSTCGVEKDYSEFYKDKRKKNGLYSNCKQCHREAMVKYKDNGGYSSKEWCKENPTYWSFKCMKTRCECKSHSNYKNYGGKGIRVCDRWKGRGGYKNFLEDMGERPTISGVPYQIDRIDNDGDYSPGNCRWVTQAHNLARRTWS